MKEILEMSKNEIEKYHLLQQVIEKKISQIKAAELLKLSDRRVRNLLKRFKEEGIHGLISKKRGKSNRAYNVGFKKQVIALAQVDLISGAGNDLESHGGLYDL